MYPPDTESEYEMHSGSRLKRTLCRIPAIRRFIYPINEWYGERLFRCRSPRCGKLYLHRTLRGVLQEYHGCICGNKSFTDGWPTRKEKILLWLHIIR